METGFSRIVGALPGFVWTARPDGCCDFISRRWCEFTGLDLEHAMGRGWMVAIHPADRPRLVEQLRTILAAGRPGELEGRMRRFDGEFRLFSFRVAPVTDELGRLIKWCGVNTDIEDHRRAEDALRRHQAQLTHGQALSQTGSFSWRLCENS